GLALGEDEPALERGVAALVVDGLSLGLLGADGDEARRAPRGEGDEADGDRALHDQSGSFLSPPDGFLSPSSDFLESSDFFESADFFESSGFLSSPPSSPPASSFAIW